MKESLLPQLQLLRVNSLKMFAIPFFSLPLNNQKWQRTHLYLMYEQQVKANLLRVCTVNTKQQTIPSVLKKLETLIFKKQNK